jgi:hypothetical protein
MKVWSLVGQHQLTCLMHRRTRVPHGSLAFIRPAQQLRWQFTQWATTWSQACRYRIGLAWNAALLPIARPHFAAIAMAGRVAFVPQTFVAKQIGRSEHQVSGLRRKTQGIVPDVFRPEMDAPTTLRFRSGQRGRTSTGHGAGSKHAGVSYLRHFSLVQPYF